jgi:hypothetical protein
MLWTRSGPKVPDYNPTLAKINANMAEFAKHMKAVEQSEALRITPESMAGRIAAAAEGSRESDRIAIKEARDQIRQNNATMSRTVGTIRTKGEQRRYVLFAVGIAILAISLLWLLYPGWAASMAPQGWHWPERAARRTMGGRHYGTRAYASCAPGTRKAGRPSLTLSTCGRRTVRPSTLASSRPPRPSSQCDA